MFTASGIAGFWIYWVPERFAWPWAIPAGVLFGFATATLHELWNRPREFLRDVRRLGRRFANLSY